MQITKEHLRIIRYIYRKQPVTYRKIHKHFHRINNLESVMDALVFNDYMTRIDEHPADFGEYTDITESTLFRLNTAGIVEVEKHQWFDGEYVVSHILIPIILAVISTLITIFLSQML